MTAIDYEFGPKAEYLNAWSPVQYLFTGAPDEFPSEVAERIGYHGELVVVLFLNAIIGTMLALIIKAISRKS